MIKMEFEGGRDIEAAMMELKRSTARGVARRVVRKAAQPVADAANAAAPRPKDTPRDPWRLKGSFRVSSVLQRRLRRGAKAARGENTVEVYVGSPDANAILSEFGTARQRAVPALRQAWARTYRDVFGAIRTGMAAEVAKAVRRARARSGGRR